MRYILIISLFIASLFANDAWNKNNLLNKKNMTYFIPFELWLGVKWDGKRAKTFHEVDTTLKTSLELKGPFSWYHPYLKKQLQVYKRTSQNNIELFTFYPAGVIKVYDKKHDAYLNNGITFPLGYGWKIGKPYYFSQEVWIRDKHQMRKLGITIQKLDFEKEKLTKLVYDYSIDEEKVATYTYTTDEGMTKIQLAK